MCSRCVVTVRKLTTRCAAIWALVKPAATRRATSISLRLSWLVAVAGVPVADVDLAG